MKRKNKPYTLHEDKFTIWEGGEQLYLIDFRTFEDKPVQKKKKNKQLIGEHELNDLDGSEWTKHGKSVQVFNSPITEKRKKHGAAFPIVLAKHFIKIYSKPGDTIFDPFAGVGTTLDAANILKRHSLGIELNKEFIKLFNQGIYLKDGKPNSEYRRILIQDSALNLYKQFHINSVGFLEISSVCIGKSFPNYNINFSVRVA